MWAIMTATLIAVCARSKWYSYANIELNGLILRSVSSRRRARLVMVASLTVPAFKHRCNLVCNGPQGAERYHTTTHRNNVIGFQTDHKTHVRFRSTHFRDTR